MTESYPVVAAAPAAEPLALTPEEQAEVDKLYAELKPAAVAEAREYVLARTPAAYQEAMVALIETDFPPPVDAPPELLASRKRDLESGERRAEVVPALVPA